MALVAYDNSDVSDYEDEDSENSTVVSLIKKPGESIPGTEPRTVQEIEEKVDKSHQEDGPSLFNLLPRPASKKTTVIEEDDEFLHKKEESNSTKSKAKISVPSLRDFKDVENSMPMVKPKTANGKKSGLLSILPQPRHSVTATTKSLIPHVLSQKPSQSVKKESVKSVIPAKKTKIDPNPLINDYSDDSDNDEVANDFFSINKQVTIPDYVEPSLDSALDVEQEEKSQMCTKKPRGIESFFKKDAPVNHVHLEADNDESMPEQGATSSSYENPNSNNVELDEEAIMKLCGTRGKRKREEIQIVDVNQQEVLADAREWLLKGLMDDTTKRVSASKKKGNEFTNQQRRKHQITYLAYQAKANEAELQNQWANNRMSKKQTQAKYGF